MAPVVLGSGTLGAFVGLLVAYSATPIVAGLLPLLFGLLGGASGFFIFKINFENPNKIKQLKLFGWSLAAFAGTSTFALLVGINTKASIINSNSVAALPENSMGIMPNLIMRKRLELLG